MSTHAGSRSLTSATLALTVVAVVLAAPSAASAATRVASPNGSGLACDSATPCDITTALAQAGDGDEVVLQPGSYGTTATPIATDLLEFDDVDLHGVEGQPRPVITSSANAPLVVSGANSTLRHIEVQGLNPLNIGALDFRGKLAEDFVANAGGVGGRGCQFEGTPLVRNGVCSGTGFGELSSGVSSPGINPTLRNMTLRGGDIGIGVQSTAARPTRVNIVNTIAIGGAFDVQVFGFTDDATLTTSHSNYSLPAQLLPNAGGDAILTSDGTDQTAEPLLTNPGQLDLRQLAGSPTIDAGAASSDNGATDIEGQFRTQNGAPDIGADEFDVPLTADLSAKRRQPAKRLKVTLDCSSECTAHLTGKGKADGRGFSTRASDKTVAGGSTTSARLRLRKKTLKRVDDERGRLTITAEVTDLNGHAATDTARIKLIPK